MTKRFDVLGLGCAAVDDLLYIDSFPAPDSKTEVLRRERQCGGLTATALVAAARFGANCAYGGMLGHDELSGFVERALREEGVDLSHVVRHDDARPAHSVIIVSSTEGTRNIFFDVSARTGADDALPAEEIILASRVLFLDDYNTPGNLRALDVARRARIPVVADIERDNLPGFEAVVAGVDHLVLSAALAWRLTGESDAPRAIEKLWTSARATVVLTDGARGCWCRSTEASGIHHQPAFAVDVVDTTGCGDVFHGVYAAALALGTGVQDRIHLAAAAAALKATQAGGQRGIPHLDQIREFLKSRCNG